MSSGTKSKKTKTKAKSSGNGNKSVISVCLGTGGIAAGGDKVFARFEKEIKSKKLDTAIGKRACKTAKTGCKGLCVRDVLVDITVPGKEALTYERVTVDMVPQIIEDHLIKHTPVKKWLAKDDYHKFHDNQKRLVLGNCGAIDPENIDEYIIKGGYSALKKALGMVRPAVIAEIKNSGLRGRGGAGFKTGWKWESCSEYNADEKFIICNGDEGSPGAFMDISIMEGDPHALLEGMIIGGYAIGATKGYIHTRTEYTLAVERLHIAIRQAKEKGFLGENILNSGYSLDIIVKEGASGAFVCGESTALLYSIEGKRGMPRTRPPQSVEAGLWGKPTCLNNVETFANVPIIINRGAKWYSKIGTKKSKGTKIFALTGNVKNTGLIEVPMGITIREIVFDIGGGIPKKKKFKAAQIGGPSGGCLPESYLDKPIDYESLLEAGAIMGSGSIVVADETTCVVDMARFLLDFCANESCGKCPPCRVGTTLMLDILIRITQGEGKEEDLDVLEQMCDEMFTMSLCGLGRTAPNPVVSTIRYFRDEYLAHIRDKECPTATCVALHKYTVVPDKCTKCTLCIRNCPVNAIKGSKDEVAFIDKEKCTECNLCYEKCNFMAIK
jgi:NADH:ubiquinone oxidoreductase subunit F (NADH-binding)